MLKKWFDTSNYDRKDERPLPIGENKKVIGLFKDELGGKIMIELVALRARAYTYSKEDGSEHKKAEGTKKCIIKRKLMFENYRDSLFNSKIIMQSQLRFKSDHHNVHPEEINKIALNSDDDKRIPAFDKVTTYSYDTNAFKVCENELLSKIYKMINSKF